MTSDAILRCLRLRSGNFNDIKINDKYNPAKMGVKVKAAKNSSTNEKTE